MIDLKKFCSKEKYRPYLMNPFRIPGGDQVYATDGCVIVVIDNGSAFEAEENGKLAEGIQELFSKRYTDCEKAIIPSVKVTTEKCKSCDGEGEGFHDCASCECVCDACNGDGNVAAKTVIKIGEAFFDAKYINAITHLPGAKIAVAPDKREASPFSFDGGIGLLMPMYADSSDFIFELHDGVFVANESRSPT